MILVIAIGLATGCVYAVVAVGYSTIYRTTAVVNFAQGSYVMIGGFGTYWFYGVAHWPYPLAILAGIAVAALTGFVLWIAVVLPLWRRRAPSYIVLLETIVFGVIVSTAALLVLGPMPQTLPPWIPGFALAFGDSRVDGQYVVVAAATILLLGSCSAVLRFTALGRAMRACAASRETSALLGIASERIGAIAFTATATAALGGLGGALITPAQFTSSDAGLAYGVFGFVAAVLGGFGSLGGALIGGLLLGLIDAAVGRYLSSNYQTVISFGILLALLAFRPQGIVGEQWEES
ncbi:MAG TPA: branched-chain amino acid ABC transporter permease [Stellaceae bacterium]|nr:branched-chain amino acid ABC transporter permease [Stellaceae bacterium]